MPATPRNENLAHAVVEAILIGGELGQRAARAKAALEQHEAPLADAEKVAAKLVTAQVFLEEDRDDLVAALREPGGAMDVVEKIAELYAAQRHAPEALGGLVGGAKSAAAAAGRPRGPAYGPRHFSEHAATLASNERIAGYLNGVR